MTYVTMQTSAQRGFYNPWLEQKAPPPSAPVPAPDDAPLNPAPLALDCWRVQERSTPSASTDIELTLSSSPTEIALRFHLPEASDQAYGAFSKAVATHIWRYCPQAGVQFSSNGRYTLIDLPDQGSSQSIERAIAEIRTLLAFIDLNNGDLGHVCRIVREEAQLVAALHAVLQRSNASAVRKHLGPLCRPAQRIARSDERHDLTCHPRWHACINGVPAPWVRDLERGAMGQQKRRHRCMTM